MNQIAEPIETVDPAALETTLTALDRCDSCGAQAYVRVVLASGELLFCAHHAHEVEAKLRPAAILWQDETARLAEDAKA